MARKDQDMASMFEAFVAFMGAQATDDSPRERPAGGRSSKTAAKTTAKASKPASKRSTNRSTAKATAGVITCGEAWKLLGADPTYAPSNPNAPARNAQLWALNSKGLLAVR